MLSVEIWSCKNRSELLWPSRALPGKRSRSSFLSLERWLHEFDGGLVLKSEKAFPVFILSIQQSSPSSLRQYLTRRIIHDASSILKIAVKTGFSVHLGMRPILSVHQAAPKVDGPSPSETRTKEVRGILADISLVEVAWIPLWAGQWIMCDGIWEA